MDMIVRFFKAAPDGFDFPGTAEQTTGPAAIETAGHGSTWIDHVPFQCDDPAGILDSTGHCCRIGKLACDDDPAQKRVQDIAQGWICLHEIAGQADETRHAFQLGQSCTVEAAATNRGHRQESGPSCPIILEIGNQTAGSCFVVSHDIGNSRSQGSFQCQFQIWLDADQFTQSTNDPLAKVGLFLGLVHDPLD